MNHWKIEVKNIRVLTFATQLSSFPELRSFLASTVAAQLQPWVYVESSDRRVSKRHTKKRGHNENRKPQQQPSFSWPRTVLWCAAYQKIRELWQTVTLSVTTVITLSILCELEKSSDSDDRFFIIGKSTDTVHNRIIWDLGIVAFRGKRYLELGIYLEKNTTDIERESKYIIDHNTNIPKYF